MPPASLHSALLPAHTSSLQLPQVPQAVLPMALGQRPIPAHSAAPCQSLGTRLHDQPPQALVSFT